MKCPAPSLNPLAAPWLGRNKGNLTQPSLQSTPGKTIGLVQFGNDANNSATTSPSSVINEALCFIQNKVNVAPVDIIVKICADFYDVDYLLRSKVLLYDTAQPTVKRRSRRGDKKAEQTVRDIIDIFLAHNEREIPCYVARDLTMLPPLHVNDLDVLHLSREIKAMKDSICQLTSNQMDILGMVTDGRNTHQITTPVAERSGHHSSDSSTPNYIVISEAVCDESSVLSTPMTVITDSADEDSSNGYASMDEKDTVMDEMIEPRSPIWQKKTNERKIKQSKSKQSTAGGDDSGVVIGTGSYRNVRAADMRFGPIRQKVLKPKYNQTMCGIFITRLSPQTTVRQLKLHIRKETGYDVRPEKMPVKRDDLYSSWFIRVANPCRQALFSSHLWPKHTLIKPYYN